MVDTGCTVLYFLVVRSNIVCEFCRSERAIVGMIFLNQDAMRSGATFKFAFCFEDFGSGGAGLGMDK